MHAKFQLLRISEIVSGEFFNERPSYVYGRMMYGYEIRYNLQIYMFHFCRVFENRVGCLLCYILLLFYPFINVLTYLFFFWNYYILQNKWIWYFKLAIIFFGINHPVFMQIFHTMTKTLFFFSSFSGNTVKVLFMDLLGTHKGEFQKTVNYHPWKLIKVKLIRLSYTENAYNKEPLGRG